MPPVQQLLGSRYRTVRVSVGTVPFSKGNAQEIEIPNSLLSKNLFLRLTGNLIIGVANATIFSEAPLSLIRKVEIVADSRNYLVSATARELYRYAHFTHGKASELSPPSGVVGTRAFSAGFRVNHEALMFVNPVESLFDPRLYKRVLLRITWADETAIATAGGGGTIAIDGPNTSVDVLCEQTAEGASKILFDHLLSRDEKPVVATQAIFPFDIPQNGLLAGMLIGTTRDSGAGAGPVPVDDIISDIVIVSDTTVRHFDRAKWATMQRDNVQRFQLDGGATIGAQIPGWVYVPTFENGMFASALNINALNKAQLLLNVVSGAGTQVVGVVYDMFQPRRNLAQEIAAAA